VEENKKKSFGRNRSKKMSDDTNVSEITINSAFTSGSKGKISRKDMAATEKNRAVRTGYTREKDNSKRGRGCRKRKPNL